MQNSAVCRLEPLRLLLLCGLLATAVGSLSPASAPSASPSVQQAEQQPLLESFGKLPLYFVENRGQLDSRVDYYIQGRDKTIYFTPGGVTFALRSPDRQTPREESFVSDISYRHDSRLAGKASGAKARRWVVKLDFVGANPDVRPRGENPTPAVVSYFKGPSEDWNVGLPTYAGLVYEDLWPGIDLVYRGALNRLKYTFLVHPGADPNQIRLEYRGAEVKLDSQGQLWVSTPAGGFEDEKPMAYQGTEGNRQDVAAAYVLEGKTGAEGQVYGFRLGAFDPSRLLVIDPVMLVYAGYIGGTADDRGQGIAVDAAGNAYVTGFTDSPEASFPLTVGPDLTHNSGVRCDAFVAKVNADGALAYAGYIGGTADDRGQGIAVDAAGNAYVTGFTDSPEASFPVTVGPDLTFNGGRIWGDVFVAKVNADGTALAYAGYIGGTADDRGQGIAVDAAGNAYVTGLTDSPEASFPVTVGPDLTFNGGFRDVFVAKVNADGAALAYAGYIGGTESDRGQGIAVDAAGNAYVTGFTDSPEASFPVTVGPDLTFSGADDAFVAKVNADGTALAYAGYIGGTAFDQGQGIAVDAAGNAYVIGLTDSPEASFPVTVGPDLTFNGGFRDAFVAKVNADGTALAYAGYIGGTESDHGRGIAVDAAGNAYVTGETESPEASFPVTVGPDLTFNGGFWDAFVAKVNADGTALAYAGYIGGTAVVVGLGSLGDDRGQGIAVDAAGNAYVIGLTDSPEASFATVGPDLTFNGDYDAFVAKVSRETSFASVSSASFEPNAALAAEVIAAGFGIGLAPGVAVATEVPLPTELLGTRVEVTDSDGNSRASPLFFVSPGQINYLIPQGTAVGTATLRVVSGTGGEIPGVLQIERVAPSLYAANAQGTGVAAASYLRVEADGTRTQPLIFDPNTGASVPIDLGPEGDEIFLLLFGTGIRGFTSQVTATVGEENVKVLGAVPSPEFVGLDQVNIGPLPRSLAGRGEVNIVLTADGKQANTVTVNIR